MPAEAALAQEQEISQGQSISVLKNLMRLAVSSIAYTRGLFPESSFSPVEASAPGR